MGSLWQWKNPDSKLMVLPFDFTSQLVRNPSFIGYLRKGPEYINIWNLTKFPTNLIFMILEKKMCWPVKFCLHLHPDIGSIKNLFIIDKIYCSLYARYWDILGQLGGDFKCNLGNFNKNFVWKVGADSSWDRQIGWLTDR